MSATSETLHERRNSFLDETILFPGPVKINVQGAFIVDEMLPSTRHQPDDGAQHDTSDIRLPNHRAVVSHVALDIGGSLAKLVYFSREPHSKEVCMIPGIPSLLRGKLRCWPPLKSRYLSSADPMRMLKRKR